MHVKQGIIGALIGGLLFGLTLAGSWVYVDFTFKHHSSILSGPEYWWLSAIAGGVLGIGIGSACGAIIFATKMRVFLSLIITLIMVLPYAVFVKPSGYNIEYVEPWTLITALMSFVLIIGIVLPLGAKLSHSILKNYDTPKNE